MLPTLICTALLAASEPAPPSVPAPAAEGSDVALVTPDKPRLKQVTLRPVADIASTAVMGVGLLLSELAFKQFLIPDGCRWCETNDYDLWFSGVRAPLGAQRALDILSTITVVAAPALAIGANLFLAVYGGATFGDVLWDILLVMQATLSAMALQSTVKFLAGRERPLAYRLSGAEKGTTLHPEDNNLSFFSGHTAFAFAAATAAGTLAKLRGFKYPWLAWVIGFPIAALTGFLRMASDKHWLSDVLIGAAVGGAAGWFIPTLFHPREGEDGQPPRVTLAPMPLGLAVSVRLD